MTLVYLYIQVNKNERSFLIYFWSKMPFFLIYFNIILASPGCAPLAGKESAIGMLWLVSSVSCIRKGGSAPLWKAPLKGFRCATHPPPNLFCGLSCHQLCFRLPSAKDVFFSQLITARAEINSPWASTLFVLDSQIFLFMTVTLRFHTSEEWQSLLAVISVYLRPHDGLRLVSHTNAQRAKNSDPFAHSWFCYDCPSKD